MEDSLPPEKFGKTAVMEHSPYTFKNSTIKGLRNTVVLGSIMCGESAFCASGFEVIGEFRGEEFPSTVASKSFDLYTMLGICPGFEFLVCIKGIVLSM